MRLVEIPMHDWESTDYVRLSNGQVIPVRPCRRATKRNGAYVFDWNAMLPDDRVDKDLVLKNAEAAPETKWLGGTPANYGHDELYVLDETAITIIKQGVRS